MKNNIIIYSFLGLGDHFICSGAIRKIYKEEKFDTLYLIIKERDTKNIEFLYKDLEKLKLIKVQNDGEASLIVNKFKGKKYHWWWLNYDLSKTTYHEEEIYASLGFPNSTRYDDFYLDRDIKKESNTFNKIIDFNEPYTFIADDPTRGYNIDISKIPNYNHNIKTIKSSDLLEYTLFDLLKIIETAKDVHVMYSSFFILIDCLSLNKIYLHNSYLNKISPIETYGERMTNFLTYRNITHV
jgi:hypothetical protein